MPGLDYLNYEWTNYKFLKIYDNILMSYNQDVKADMT